MYTNHCKSIHNLKVAVRMINTRAHYLGKRSHDAAFCISSQETQLRYSGCFNVISTTEAEISSAQYEEQERKQVQLLTHEITFALGTGYEGGKWDV